MSPFGGSVVARGGAPGGAVVPTFFLTPNPAYSQEFHADVPRDDRERYKLTLGDVGGRYRRVSHCAGPAESCVVCGACSSNQ